MSASTDYYYACHISRILDFVDAGMNLMEESEVPSDSNDVEQSFAFLIDVYPN